MHNYKVHKNKNKRMKKSIFLLTLVAALALTACNGGAASSEATGTDSTAVAADTTLAADSTSITADSVNAATTVK
jgi:hypothetical protein